MTNQEKQSLRVALAIINNLLVRDNKKKNTYLNQVIRKHPERFETQFIIDTGFSKEEVQRLLEIRAQRLSKK